MNSVHIPFKMAFKMLGVFMFSSRLSGLFFISFFTCYLTETSSYAGRTLIYFSEEGPSSLPFYLGPRRISQTEAVKRHAEQTAQSCRDCRVFVFFHGKKYASCNCTGSPNPILRLKALFYVQGKQAASQCFTKNLSRERSQFYKLRRTGGPVWFIYSGPPATGSYMGRKYADKLSGILSEYAPSYSGIILSPPGSANIDLIQRLAPFSSKIIASGESNDFFPYLQTPWFQTKSDSDQKIDSDNMLYLHQLICHDLMQSLSDISLTFYQRIGERISEFKSCRQTGAWNELKMP